MGVNIHLGSSNYSISDFKNQLDQATTSFNKSGARKIKLGSEEFKYNEILNAVQNAIEEQKKLGATFENNDDIHTIYKDLQGLKNQGHEKTGVVTTLFRRSIPNLFRESKLNEIRSNLEKKFPSTDQLKEYVNLNKSTDLEKKAVDKFRVCGAAALTIHEAALVVNYLSNQTIFGEKERNLFWLESQPNMAVNILKTLPEKDLKISLQGLFPHLKDEIIFVSKEKLDKDRSVLVNNIINNCTKKSDFQALCSIYNALNTGLHDTYLSGGLRNNCFLGLQMKLSPDGNEVLISLGGERWYLPHEFEAMNAKDNAIAAVTKLREKMNESHEQFLSDLDQIPRAETEVVIEALSRAIDKRSNYIQEKILPALGSEVAIKEANLAEKENIDNDTYIIYINQLKDPEKTPVLNIVQAAFLSNYLLRQQLSFNTKEWQDFSARLHPSIKEIYLEKIPGLVLQESKQQTLEQMLQKLSEKLEKAQDPETIHDIIREVNFYGNVDKKSHNDAIEAGKLLVQTLKETVPREIYEKYVTEFLQNSTETPQIRFGQAAVLLDYLANKKLHATHDELRDFWLRLQPEIAGMTFSLMLEKAWPNFLEIFKLSELKELAASNGAQSTDIEPPMLHSLYSIYNVMTEDQRSKYFENLQFNKTSSGAIHVSLKGSNWEMVL